MDDWAETMQGDAYLIAADGWVAETYRVIEKMKNGKEKDKGWACDLVPKPLIVARYFAKEQSAIDKLNSKTETLASEQTELEEEHGGEDDAFGSLDKINKANVAARIKEIKDDPDSKDELKILKQWQKLYDSVAKTKKQIKDAESELDKLAHDQYPQLTEDEIKTLVVEDKWMTTIAAEIQGEMDRISGSLAARVKELAERYDAPVTTLAARVSTLEAKVNEHLRKMGFEAELTGGKP